jgi:predicted enzyme related to lactoylglutathione lyase
MAKVTGVGGVFFKSKGDRAALAEWYRKHLGVELEPWGGAAFRWPNDTADDKGVTAWHIADAGSKWFAPSDASFMINYRVDDLDQMVENLRTAGVQIVGGPESHENGEFAWILDLDGNKVELWQPMAWDEKNKHA